MDELKLRQQVDRGLKAESLLRDPFIQEAFDLVESHILQKFKDAPIRDEEGVIKAKQLLHAFSLVKGAFESAIKDGEAAKLRLDPKKMGVPFLQDISNWRR